MGERVVIYTRVSTDEQAENGYSLDEQYSRIIEYCNKNNYIVTGRYQDEYSAKTFNRPKFKEFLNDIKTKKIKPEVLIVTKIDRFSRDAVKTIEMVEQLNSYGIKVFSLAENSYFDFKASSTFFMQYIQAGMAQHENLLRGENTKRGMREAQKQGKWMGKAPVGYKMDSLSKELFASSEKSSFIRESFDLMSKGIYSAEEVRKIMYKKKFKTSKNGFLNILRNPVYIGKILIKEWKEEPEQIVNGIHNSIIEEETFNLVQDIVSGRRKKISVNATRNDILLLRGFLVCKVCGGKITGSASKSRNGERHYYYHCQKGCKERFRADTANEYFEKFLSKIEINKEVLSLYFMVLKDVFKNDDSKRISESKKIENEIKLNEDRATKLESDYLDNKITSETFNEIKKKLNDKNKELHALLIPLGDTFSTFKKHMEYSLSFIHGLHQYYSNSTLAVKHLIIGSIFSEKLIFSENKYRTTKRNEVLSLITNDINGYNNSVKEKADGHVGFFDLAPSPGLEPGTP